MTDEPLTNEEKAAGEALVRRSRWMHGTWKGRLMNAVLHVLMFLEGVIWSMMDAVRAVRMRWAAKMSNEN